MFMDGDRSLPLRLHAALKAGDVRPHLQPIVSLDDERIVGFEILARWVDSEQGVIGPDTFIPVADKHGLLDGLLDQLMRAAFTAAADWPNDVFLGFNVAPSQLLSPELVTRVKQAADDCRFPLTRVHIEVTETALMHDMARAERTLQKFIDLGCMIAMDDFGTGYSSLSWLSALPFSKIKIDTQFVAAMAEQRQSRKIVAAVIALGQSLGLAVVAEGVENPQQAELLKRMGCQLAQGYLYSRPVPVEQVASLLTAAGHSAEAHDPQPAQMSVELQAFQLAALYESEQTAIAFTDPGGTILAASTAFGDLLSDRQGSVVGRRIDDLVPFAPEMLAQLRADDLLHRTLPAFECPTHDGGRGLIVVRPVRDEERELVGLSVVIMDTSTHPATSDTSRTTRGSISADDRYAWQLSDRGLVVSVDDTGAAGAGTGHELADLGEHLALGTGWVDFVHPDDVGDALRGYAEAISTGQPYDVDLRLHGGDGIYQWFRVHTVPEYDADSGAVRWHGHCESLARSGVYASRDDQWDELLFSFESTPYTSWIAGTDGIVARISGGDTPRARTGRTHIAELYDALDAPAVRAKMTESLQRAQSFDMTYTARLNDVTTSIRCCGVPRRHPDGTVVSWHGVILPAGAATEIAQLEALKSLASGYMQCDDARSAPRTP